MNKLFRDDLDSKMFRDLVLSFAVCFTYVAYNSLVAGMAGTILVSATAAGFFALISEIVRNLVEVDLEMKKSLSKEEVARKYQMRLVLRDSLITFVLAYGVMTSQFAGVLTLSNAAAYIVAALAPTLIVAVVSKEMRVPFLAECEENDVVVNEIDELRKAA